VTGAKKALADGPYFLILMGGAAIIAYALPAFIFGRGGFDAPWSLYAGLELGFLAMYCIAAVVAWRRRTPRPDVSDGASFVAGLLLGGFILVFVVVPLMFQMVEMTLLRLRLYWLQSATMLGALVLYIVGGVWFYKTRPKPAPMPASEAKAPAGPWNDSGLITALSIVGILVGVVALFFGALVGLGVCYSGCTGLRKDIPFLMGLVPVAYVLACIAYVRNRRQRAASDPAWAAGAAQTGAKFATVVVVILLAGLTLVASCFGLVGIGTSLRP